MTALEWMESLAVASDRFRRDALNDEWNEVKPPPVVPRREAGGR